MIRKLRVRIWLARPGGVLVILTLAGALLGASEPASAQTGASEAAKRPRIGLALSGGGARGAAHIGVLKVLDELRVPVHCVAGTSMGSVVGGAFAAGTTTDQMVEVITTTDWSEVFVDTPPRAEIAVRRKIDEYRGLAAPEFGVKDGKLRLPIGVVTGVTIESFLRRITEPARNIHDFSRLPVPFAAVATNIENGEAVVLERGNLAQAMRASMAIPGAVNPVEIDGKLLVDGGIANNFPIDITRKLCADVVIAVNISTLPLKRDEITSVLSVMGQLINLLGKDSADRQAASLTERDVLIEPDLGDITAGSFERQGEAIKIGEAAARKLADRLRRYSLPPDQYAALRKRQIATDKGLGKVDEIRFTGIERTNEEVLRELIQTKPGEELDENKIAADLRRIYGRDDFEAVSYQIEQIAGRPVLLINVKEKSIGPDYLRFGLGLAADSRGQANFNVVGQYRRTWLNKLGAEWLVELQVGEQNSLYTEFYQPLHERGRFFVAPYAGLGQFTRNVYVGDDAIADYRIRDYRAGVDFGVVFGQAGQLRIGPIWRRVEANVDIGDPALPSIDVNASGVTMRFLDDRLDGPYFPRSGSRTLVTADAVLTSMGASQSYQRAEARWTGAFSTGPHTFSASLLGGNDFGSGLPPYGAFLLGGPLRLSGYQINRFAGTDFYFGRLQYYNRLLRLPSIIGSGVYLGASAEIGRMYGVYTQGGTATGTLYSGSVYLGSETFLGPVYIGIGYGGGNNISAYLLLGAP